MPIRLILGGYQADCRHWRDGDEVSNAVGKTSGLEHHIAVEFALEFSGRAVVSRITAPDDSQVGHPHNTTLECPGGYLAESADGMVAGCVECEDGLVCLGGTSFEGWVQGHI
ncbi:hypothetical protein CYMTET_40551 [Cymbomonas tetramitiformis]|uniref:Uncharacterized protein n=1 Tax=Cymbomonas tetramitiformis TaxID=36881 RepID=A0AAE0C7U0_9CHLO|nr:hypothetical protein CYMTET_40551 [Cymbomonas tetramitiformis]